jgi:hypothetical protein
MTLRPEYIHSLLEDDLPKACIAASARCSPTRACSIWR